MLVQARSAWQLVITLSSLPAAALPDVHDEQRQLEAPSWVWRRASDFAADSAMESQHQLSEQT
jgi:hypothetical protein